MNRGLTESDYKYGGIGVLCKYYYDLLLSIDSNQSVKNIFSSHKYHSMEFSLNFTCKMKNNFGVAPIKNCLDSQFCK